MSTLLPRNATLRFAHFVQRYPPALGGSEAFVARLSRYLASAGNAVTVFTTAAVDLEAFWAPHGRCLPAGVTYEGGVEVRRYALWRRRGRRYLLKALSMLPHRGWQCLTMPCNPISWNMRKDAGRTAPTFDIVHATAFPYAWPIVCGLRLARCQGIPFLLTPFLHLGDPDDPADRTRRAYLSPALRWLLRQADALFAQTQPEVEALRDCGIAEDKIHLLGMGIEPHECVDGDRDKARRGWDVRPDEVVVGHLANNSEEKGTADLLRAAELAWSRGQRFRLVLAGPEMPNFRYFWSSYSSKSAVVRLGVLSEEEKRDFFAGLDLFALPSRSDSFGIVLLEAWANGIANIGYRAGGVAGLIRHEQDGLLVPCGSLQGLADALTRLVNDVSLRQRFGQTGRARAFRDFRWPDKLEHVRQVYMQTLARKQANGAGLPQANAMGRSGDPVAPCNLSGSPINAKR